MEKEKTTTETSAQTIVSEESTDDTEAKITALEAEKAKLIEEKTNYQVAYLKEKKKNNSGDVEETPEETMRRIAREEASNAKIASIDTEKEVLLQKALKENKELKLANKNKGNVVQSTSTHSEGQIVRDTSLTPEQEQTLRKKRGWTDKDIERYKKNLARYK